ncbi:MAG: hypothetical protein GQ559_08460 [Desulfobulbaceae bacterium]|nr:hypothetical protein [Desulfobulbaceae bacterium]
MATGSEQLVADYEQLQSTLELYPSINITGVEGQPPDTYEIEYNIRGYVKTPEGEIEIGKQHRVRISLPFGYPHFAPTVKPLTPIFHPDIDPVAVRIAEQWQANASLTDLILHIGEMIWGNTYNIQYPFNQHAADWYSQHQENLPLDVLQIADIEDSDELFDTLDEDTFASLGLEDDDLMDAGPGEEAKPGTDATQIDLIRTHLRQKKLFTANRLLSEIAATVPIPDREELEQTIADGLRETDRLYRDAEKLEDKGRFKEAAAVADQIASIAEDSPGLGDLQSRIRQSLELSQGFTLAEESKSSETEKKQNGPTESTSAARKIALQEQQRIPVKLFIFAAILFGVAIAGGALYFRDCKTMDQVDADWKQAGLFTEKRLFYDARLSAETALSNLQSIVLLRSQKNALTEEIQTVLDSQDFLEGLQGRILYDGKYVSEAEAKILEQLAQLTDQAEQLLKKGKITKSIKAYENAQHYALKNTLSIQAQTINQTINNLRFEQTMAKAKKAENEKEWEHAAETYRRALEISQTLTDVEGTEEIGKRLTAATFRHELDQSKEAFTESQWKQTIDMLEHAKRLIDQNPSAVSGEERIELDRLLINSRLYQMLAIARHAYERRNWNVAIAEYEKTLNLLDREAELFGDDLGNSASKIEKTLLMVKVAREQSRAHVAEQTLDLEQVLSHYKKILTLIQNSKFNSDATLQSLQKNIETQIVNTGAQLKIKRKKDYLEENYVKIFKKHYPSFNSSKLKHPKASFDKYVEGTMIFTLSCIERNRGSSTRLELNYQYNPATNKWSLYIGQ